MALINPPDRGWRSSRGQQDAIEALNRILDGRFGVATKEAPYGPLRRGLIGVAVDDQAQEIVVVIDSELVDEVTLERNLRAAVDAIAMRVQTGCHSAVELARAGDALGARVSVSYSAQPASRQPLYR